MITNMTAARVLMLHGQRQQLRGSFFELMELNKINAYYQKNGMRIQTLLEKEEKIKVEFLELDEKGVPKLSEEKLPIYKEGKTDAEYKAAATAFYETIIPIDL